MTADTDEGQDDDDHDHDHDLYGKEVEQVCADRGLKRSALKLAGGHPQDAEDHLQEAFYRALKYPKRPGEVRNHGGFINHIMRNVVVNEREKAGKLPTESLDELMGNPARQKEQPRVDPEVERISKNQALLDELKGVEGALTADERFLLWSLLGGKRLEDGGKTIEEIASELGENKLLTKARWERALARLKYLIKKGRSQNRGSGRPGGGRIR